MTSKVVGRCQVRVWGRYNSWRCTRRATRLVGKKDIAVCGQHGKLADRWGSGTLSLWPEGVEKELL